jgi:hypothetical protein
MCPAIVGFAFITRSQRWAAPQCQILMNDKPIYNSPIYIAPRATDAVGEFDILPALISGKPADPS